MVIAEDVDGEALATLVVNKLRGTLHVCAVKAPGFGDRRKAMLEDIAVLAGGQVVRRRPRRQAREPHPQGPGFGQAHHVGEDNNTTVDGAGKDADLKARIKQIKAQVEETSSDYDREKLQERLAKLVGGVAVINVGAATEVEMKEKKARVEDAMHATRAAREEGIVPGGGIALVRARSGLKGAKLASESQNAGVNPLFRATEEPLRQMAVSAGQEGLVVLDQVASGKGALGFNAAGEVYEDLKVNDTIDPTEVVRTPSRTPPTWRPDRETWAKLLAPRLPRQRPVLPSLRRGVVALRLGAPAPRGGAGTSESVRAVRQHRPHLWARPAPQQPPQPHLETRVRSLHRGSTRHGRSRGRRSRPISRVGLVARVA